MSLGNETPGSQNAGCNGPDENRNHYESFQDDRVYDNLVEDLSAAAE